MEPLESHYCVCIDLSNKIIGSEGNVPTRYNLVSYKIITRQSNKSPKIVMFVVTLLVKLHKTLYRHPI